jgi:hypothetical protein
LRSSLRRRLALVLLAPAAVGLAGCGGGGDDKDVEELLDKAFRQSIDSGQLKVEAQVRLEGLRGLDKPIRFQATGPFKSNENKLPSFDIDLNVNAGGGGQTVRTGRLSTGDRLFVKFEDTFYEVDSSQVRRTNDQIARDRRSRDALKRIGPNARKWLRDARTEGDTEVAGTETTHVAGKLDVGATLRGLNDFAARAGRALGPGAAPTTRLPDNIVRQAEEVIEDPSFDVYVGKDDDVIRRMSANVKFDVPEDDRQSLGGLERGSLELTIELADVNGDQKIEPPARSRPISDLSKSLGGGGLNGLGGVPEAGGAPEAGGGQAPPSPSPGGGTPAPGGGTPAPGGSGGSGGSGGQASPDADAFKRYAECLDDADAADTQALQDCARLLR